MTVYVYPTKHMLSLLKGKTYKLSTAKQPGYDGITAEGWIVPITDVPELRILKFNSCSLWKDFGCTQHAISTTKKGEIACDIVMQLLHLGRFPLWIKSRIKDDKDLQIKGTDIFVDGKWRIQTKCDWLAAPKIDGGTGNLFIQTKELNPLKLH